MINSMSSNNNTTAVFAAQNSEPTQQSSKTTATTTENVHIFATISGFSPNRQTSNLRPFQTTTSQFQPTSSPFQRIPPPSFRQNDVSWTNINCYQNSASYQCSIIRRRKGVIHYMKSSQCLITTNPEGFPFMLVNLSPKESNCKRSIPDKTTEKIHNLVTSAHFSPSQKTLLKNAEINASWIPSGFYMNNCNYNLSYFCIIEKPEEFRYKNYSHACWDAYSPEKCHFLFVQLVPKEIRMDSG